MNTQALKFALRQLAIALLIAIPLVLLASLILGELMAPGWPRNLVGALIGAVIGHASMSLVRRRAERRREWTEDRL